MEKITHSPLPVKNIKGVAYTTIDFYEAMRQVVKGKKVSKEEWGDKEIYGFLNKEILSLHKKDGNYQWIINEGDMAGKDWIIVT